VITIYRRHQEGCKFTSRRNRGCRCAIWAEGTVHGQKIRRSLDLRDWEAAVRLVREWEIHAPQSTVTVVEAAERFVADAKARLRASSVLKYEQSVKALKEKLGPKTIRQVTVDDVRALRESWKISPITMQKRLEMVKAFFRFCVASGWIDASPAALIKAPKFKQQPTLPFEDEEVDRIFTALDEKYLEAHPFSNETTKIKIRAFILVMLHTGIRISDAVFLKRERVKNGKLFLYTHKTNVPVWVPLPNEVLEALKKCEGDFYFSTGRGTVKTWTTEWEERLKKVFKLAGLPEAHSHMLRDTFSVRLLRKGVPMETVAALLGNTVKVVEKHYSPWVQARQNNLEESVRRTWIGA
jgi:integrase